MGNGVRVRESRIHFLMTAVFGYKSARLHKALPSRRLRIREPTGVFLIASGSRSAPLDHQRPIHGIHTFCSMMLNPVLPIVAQEIETQTIRIQLNYR